MVQPMAGIAQLSRPRYSWTGQVIRLQKAGSSESDAASGAMPFI